MGVLEIGYDIYAESPRIIDYDQVFGFRIIDLFYCVEYLCSDEKDTTELFSKFAYGCRLFEITIKRLLYMLHGTRAISKNTEKLSNLN